MAKISPLEVEGFDELNRKLKQLPDRVKRKEVLGVQRKLALPVRKLYERNLPKDSGTLSRSVAVKTVPIRKSGGNPAIAVRPGKRGRNNGYYKFMVIDKGSTPGSNTRGSRKGLNTVVERARNKTLAQIEAGVTKEAEIKTARYIQQKIDRLK